MTISIKNNTLLFIQRKKIWSVIISFSRLLLLVAAISFCTLCFFEKVQAETEPPANNEKWEVVIIGAGAGGLSAGVTLNQAGVKTLVLEQHDRPGGYMTAFNRGDYRFEVSLHWMDGLDPGGPTRELFQKLGILDRVKPIKLDSLFQIMSPEFSFDFPSDQNLFMSRLQELFPEEAEGIEKFFKKLDNIYNDGTALSRLQDEFILLRLAKYMILPFLYHDFIRAINVPLNEMTDKYISDERLKIHLQTLTAATGLPPSQIQTAYYAFMWGSFFRHGAYHFVGGSQAVSNALADVIAEKGGEVRLNTLVEKILIEDGRAVGVRTAEGREIHADYVISNANAHSTYFKLVGEEHLKPKFVKYIKGLEPGISATQVFLGLDLDLKKVGLGDITEIACSISTQEVDTTKFFDNLMTMNIEQAGIPIGLYSNIDPTCAPPGKSVAVITFFSYYDWENRWRIDEGREAYQALKAEVAERMIKVAETCIPGLRDSIEVMETSSPLTMERYTLNYKGAFMGWAPIPEQNMLKRMKQKTPLDNLYLAGAWTFPGGGQSACLLSGYSTAEKILKKIK